MSPRPPPAPGAAPWARPRRGPCPTTGPNTDNNDTTTTTTTTTTTSTTTTNDNNSSNDDNKNNNNNINNNKGLLHRGDAPQGHVGLLELCFTVVLLKFVLLVYAV